MVPCAPKFARHADEPEPARRGRAGDPPPAQAAEQPVIGQPAKDKYGCAKIEPSLPTLADWPKVDSRFKGKAGDEARIAQILSGMTLEEKVGQMTQPEITSITPDEVRQYAIGTVLNGGGAWPGGNKHATQQDWLNLADAYWDASKSSRTKIPVIWGIDAVHGNNNVYGATVFPHNIGLGAAHDPCLVRDVAAATARQIRATGQDWAFSPTLAVVQDDRWGRTYEGFSEDPRITRAYGYEAIDGLQDDATKRIGRSGVIATAKHFIGDGGTLKGQDQGVNPSSEAEMINVHGQGYYGALAAGTQTVMVSFNSWTNADLGINEGKLHGSDKALNQILKGKMGFDGLVVSDWNGIGQVPGCTNSSCPQAINAGIDVVMVPADWKAFITNTVAQVQSGQIPMARIDDAVTRILRVKLRDGIFEAQAPSDRSFAESGAALTDHQLARAAARESQVLLKNNGNVLPLKPKSKVLVVGKSADSIQNQTGGWTLSWQGTGNTNADFPNATSILAGIKQDLGDANVTFDEKGDVDPKGFDAVIAVIGETPYAEGVGDLTRKTLEASKLYPEDLAVLDKVSGKGTPVATVYVGGRPLYMNKEINRSDAFVAAWLPGTEGGGVADMMVKGKDGNGLHGHAVLLVAEERVPVAAQPVVAGLRPAVQAGLRPQDRPARHGRPARRDPRAGVLHLHRWRRDGDRGPVDLRPHRRRAVQEPHRLGVELGRHRDRPGRHGRAQRDQRRPGGRQRAGRRAEDDLDGHRPGPALHAEPGGHERPAQLPERRRGAGVRHGRAPGAGQPDGDQHALRLPVLLRGERDEAVHRPGGGREDDGEDPVVLLQQRAGLRAHQHAVPGLHRRPVLGLVRERAVGATGGEGS